MLTLGIDIAGAPGRKFDLAFIEWDNSFKNKSNVYWSSVPLGTRNNDYPNYNMEEIRKAADNGNLEAITNLTYTILTHVAERLNIAIQGIGIDLNKLRAIAIDSPSGFSRNQIGHGRATEKVWGRLIQGHERNDLNVAFQMSPSIACRRMHNNNWFWMIFGMAAFHILENNYHVDNRSWSDFLKNGLANRNNVIEVFPRVTIQNIRKQGVHAVSIIKQIVNNLDNIYNESQLIYNSLDSGNGTASDRADAVISAMTMLPFVYPEKFKLVPLMHILPTNYQPIDPIPWEQEGVIYTLEIRNWA